jgi:hypothetical protein
MDPEELGANPDKPRPRPKVVDKRVSARTDGGPPPPPPPAAEPAGQPTAEPAPAATEPDPEPRGAPTPPEDVSTPAAASAGGAPGDAAAASRDAVWTPEQEEHARQLAQEIAETPSYEWVVNTAVTLANVAGTKLDLGAVADAQLAIDALGGILDAAGPRLQQAEAPLRQTLAQLRLAYAERIAPPPA